MSLAPIILFVYNRPWHTQQTVEALQKNELATESDLFIFADGAKTENDEKVNEVRKYIKTITGFKSVTIFEKEKNCGLANSVIAGVTEIINKFGKVIVVEDDIVTSKYFLKFMNEALDFFENDEQIFSVSGYNYSDKKMKIPKSYKDDIYLSYRHESWGWGTWKNRWERVDWKVADFKEFSENIELQKAFNRGGADMSEMLKAQMNGKIDSWAIRFDYALFKNNCFNIKPVQSLVYNIGLTSGTHFNNSKTDKFITKTDNTFCPKISMIKPSEEILENYKRISDTPKKTHRYSLKRFMRKMRNKFSRLFFFLIIKLFAKTSPVSNVFGFDRGTPIDRYYIDKFLESNKSKIVGTVLEIAENSYSIKFGDKNIVSEILHFDNSNPKATMVGDLTKKETLPKEKYDCFICTQTFNFIYDIKKALAGSYYLLKENGTILATVSGISQISRYDMDRWGDFWRFTDKSTKQLFAEVGFSTVEVSVFGNVFAATAFLQGLAVEDIPSMKLLDVVDEDYQVTIGIKAVK